MSGVLVGKSSFLGGALAKALPGTWTHLSYKELAGAADTFAKADIVINCAYHPAMRDAEYRVDNDIDNTIARMIGQQTYYVMLSSRMVYGESLPGPRPFIETDKCEPVNFYGKNKLIVEQNLAHLLGQEKLIVLRLSNILGLELGRSTFMGAAQTSLKEKNQIIFDLAPDSKRDFLPVKQLSNFIKLITKNPCGGIYNIGSGVAVPCNEISSWLIEGYGSGETIYIDHSEKGQFAMNVDKSIHTFALPIITKDDIRQECIECGQKLR